MRRVASTEVVVADGNVTAETDIGIVKRSVVDGLRVTGAKVLRR